MINCREMRNISKTEYETLLAQSGIIEQDGYGVKVIRLPDGNFLKTFWYRRAVSSRRIYPEWLRFKHNAGVLTRRGIPTVTVLETVRIPHLKRSGVIYRPLAGRTLRQVDADGDFTAQTAERAGAFIAELHRKGIHFRSLHFGNVLLCPDGAFGLIDISRMETVPWPLCAWTRRRNLAGLFRYPQDVEILERAGMQSFKNGLME